MHHYPHHIGDYSKDTPGLTMLEHGAYRLLMDAYYAGEAPIAADEPYAIAKAANSLERKAVDKVLRKFFALRDGFYHQKRIDEEIAVYQEKAAKNRENGRLGGRPRNNPDGNPEETQTVTQTVSETKPKHNPEITLTNSHEPITKKAEGRATRLPADWRLSSEQIQWALEKRPDWNGEHVLRVGEMFRNHWLSKPGKDAAKLDWGMVWKNWVLRDTTKIRSDGRTGNGVAL